MNKLFLYIVSLLFLFFFGCDLISEKEDKKDLTSLVAILVATNSNSANINPPTNLSYTGSPFVFFRNAPISAKVPTAVGTIESCQTNVTMPTGISLSDSCTISGTATANKATTLYTITATNRYGTGSTTISIQVKDSLCGNGVIEGLEVCDDNNATNGDGCNNTCSGA
ncbi:DUF4215 domain-containing protein [Leptospira kanakyensis]|uniref:DUF4215 domain-containing protein n=1 Tax=Leptospira kanakyensis TaxID=2484968 RepID=UPI00223DABB9|nr:DUF4215 domain-containing protein [Leptospira kanakyensis]MCW7482821.1 DUF4215 domain-containing protein [Leptospira kanakyensis]